MSHLLGPETALLANHSPGGGSVACGRDSQRPNHNHHSSEDQNTIAESADYSKNSRSEVDAAQKESGGGNEHFTLKVLAVRKIKERPGGGVEMTFASHGKRIQKRPRLTPEQKASAAKARRVGACLPCQFDKKRVSVLSDPSRNALENFNSNISR